MLQLSPTIQIMILVIVPIQFSFGNQHQILVSQLQLHQLVNITQETMFSLTALQTVQLAIFQYMILVVFVKHV